MTWFSSFDWFLNQADKHPNLFLVIRGNLKMTVSRSTQQEYWYLPRYPTAEHFSMFSPLLVISRPSSPSTIPWKPYQTDHYLKSSIQHNTQTSTLFWRMKETIICYFCIPFLIISYFLWLQYSNTVKPRYTANLGTFGGITGFHCISRIIVENRVSQRR